MTISLTAATNVTTDESLGVTRFPYLAVQNLPAVLESEGELCKGACPLIVFRYPVVGGWIVVTLLNGERGIAQSFVPDPDHDWYDIFPGDETQPTSQP